MTEPEGWWCWGHASCSETVLYMKDYLGEIVGENWLYLIIFLPLSRPAKILYH